MFLLSEMTLLCYFGDAGVVTSIGRSGDCDGLYDRVRGRRTRALAGDARIGRDR